MMFTAAEIEAARAIRCADELARRGMRLKKVSKELIGACPVCGGTDRFGINLPKNLWNCRGCNRGGGVIDLVRHLDGCGFRQAVETLIGAPSGRVTTIDVACLGETAPLVDAPSIEPLAAPIDSWDADEERRIASALEWWKNAEPIEGTIAERYLREDRGIMGLSPDVHGVLRFHPRCIFGQDENNRPIRHPCLIALFRDVVTNKPCGIHRIALTADCKKIDRMALGRKKGAAVKLWGDAEITCGLVAGEGVETVISAALHVKHDGTCLQPVWALIDAGNLREFPVLHGIEHLTLLADNDAADERGRRAGQEAAEICGQRWADAGRGAELFLPNKEGEDFNDVGRRRLRIAS
jgi:hypothetical protein